MIGAARAARAAEVAADTDRVVIAAHVAISTAPDNAATTGAGNKNGGSSKDARAAFYFLLLTLRG